MLQNLSYQNCFKAFMVDYFGSEHSKSSFLLHGIKEATEVLKHWMVQKDDTIFPKCVIRTKDSETSSTDLTEIFGTLI